MPPVAITVGAGTLKFSGAATLDISAQVTSAKITPEVNRGDSITVLTGEVISGAATYSATLEFSALQDMSTNGLIDWTWTHRGKTVNFEYIPDNTAAKKVSGRCVIDPLSVGGDVGTRPTVDGKFNCVGFPSLVTK